jgi:translation initiation factor IF-1
MTSPPKALFIVALVVLAGIVGLGGVGLIHGVDGARAAAHLRAAYIVREAGGRCFSALASGFSDGGGWDGATAAKGGLEFAGWAQVSNSTAERAASTPMFFGRSRVLALSIAVKQYDRLVRNPRGTWITYTKEIAEARSRLDAAIIAVESEDFGSATPARTTEAEDAAREAQENVTPATAAEQWALVVERCRKAGREDCGQGSGKTDAENAKILTEWRIRNGLPSPGSAPAQQGGAENIQREAREALGRYAKVIFDPKTKAAEAAREAEEKAARTGVESWPERSEQWLAQSRRDREEESSARQMAGDSIPAASRPDSSCRSVRGTVKAYEKGVSITVVEADGHERTVKIAAKAEVYDGLAAGDKVIVRIPFGQPVDEKTTGHVERQKAPEPQPK